MATATKSAQPTVPAFEVPAFDAAEFEAAADRVRVLNEQLIESSKKTGIVALDAYEKTLSSLLDFETKAAEATQLDWVSTFAGAHVKFVQDVSAAYSKAAREVLK